MQPPVLTSQPKVYINYELLDEEGEILEEGQYPVALNYDALTSSNSDGRSTVQHGMTSNPLNITEDGRIRVWLSRENDQGQGIAQNVYLDDFSIEHFYNKLEEQPFYRYGFQGQERDDEIKGKGNSYNYEARMLDVRIGRWLSLDPYFGEFPDNSPYVFALNSPLSFVDPTGGIVKPADNLTAQEKERYDAAIKLLNEKAPEVYNYLNTLRFLPANGGNVGKFVSPGDTGYDEAIDVIVEVSFRDTDGVPREKELKQRGNSANTIYLGSSSGSADVAGTAQISKGSGFSSNILDENNNLKIWSFEGEQVTISSVEEADKIEGNTYGNLSLIRINADATSHFQIYLDDFMGSSDLDAEVLNHELGHVEGFILYPVNTAWFQTGGRATSKGHEPGNKSGEQAEKRQQEYAKSKK
jgi:RHS repeat-associated protein